MKRSTRFFNNLMKVPSACRSKLLQVKGVLLAGSLLLSLQAAAQQENLACNTPTKWEPAATYTGLAVTPGTFTGSAGSGLSNPNAIIDGDAGTSGTLTLVATRTATGGIAGCATSSVTNASGFLRINGNATYTAGNYVGFITSANPLTTFTSFTISTINGNESGTQVAPTVTELADGTFQVGFLSTSSFNGIRLQATLSAPAIFNCGTITRSINIISPFQIKYCSGPEMPCNVAQNTSLPNFNLNVLTGGLGVADGNDVISASASDYGTFNTFLVSLGARYIGVRDNVTTYPSGTFAGFVIQNSSLVSLSLLDNFTIELYNGAERVQQASGAGLLLGGGLLSGGGPKTIGIVSTVPFNQVRIVDAGVSVGFAETRVYNAVFQKFCEGTSIACNTPTAITSPNYPLFLNTANMGIGGAACVNCELIDQDQVIDADVNNGAKINLLASVGTTGSISVKKELGNYTAGTFAGFDISNSAVLGLNLFDNISISTYLDGNATPQETRTGSSGLINVGLLNGGRQTIGFLTTLPFDEVKVTITQLAGVSLGITTVHNLVVQSFCNDGALSCNTLTNVTNPGYAVYVDMANTSVSAIGCVNCTVTNSQNVLDAASSDDFATLSLGVTVGSTASFAVGNAVTNYPVGTYAGFDVGTSGLLNVGLLSGIRIRTYLDGIETLKSSTGVGYSGTGLVVSAGLLTGQGRQVVGIVSEDVFDKIKIEFTNLGANLFGDIRVYNAVVQNLCDNNPIACNVNTPLLSPDQPVVIESSRTGLEGGVCALCSVSDVASVINTSISDYATITIPVGVLNTGSISVKNGVVTYPANSLAGFVIRDANNLLQAELLSSLTISTYNNGQFVDSETAGNLLIADVLIPIIGSTGNSISFRSSGAFDEIRISVGSVASVLNVIDVFYSTVSPYTAGCGPLPVKLASFKAAKEGEVAQLSWSTTSESNSESFEVQRSRDGKNWNAIGKRNAKGESSAIATYDFTDVSPLDGENLYRLKMIDKDATFAISGIQSLTFKMEALKIYPNPVANAEPLNIQVKDWGLVKSVKVINTLGAVVFESNGNVKAVVSTDNLAAGLYIVQVTRKDGQTVSSKFVKQ